MALVSIPPLYMPQPLFQNSDGIFIGTRAELRMNATAHRVAFVFYAPKNGNISKIGFRLGTVTEEDDNGVHVNLETIDLANGDPSGTLVTPDGGGGGSRFLDSWGPGNSDTWQEVTLDEVGAVVTDGRMYAVVFDFPNWVDGDLYLARGTNINVGVGTWLYSDQYIAAWTKLHRTGESALPFYLGYDDGTFPMMPNVLAAEGGEYNFDNADTPDEIGIRFVLPVPVRLRGVALSLEVDNACDVILYDTDGTTALQTWSLDPDVRAVASEVHHFLPCTVGQSLSTSGAYRVAVKPTTAAIVRLPYLDNAPIKDGAGDTDVWEAMGLDDSGHTGMIQKTSRTDAGGWTQDSAEIPTIQLVFDQIDNGAGGGGGGSPNLLKGTFG